MHPGKVNHKLNLSPYGVVKITEKRVITSNHVIRHLYCDFFKEISVFICMPFLKVTQVILLVAL